MMIKIKQRVLTDDKHATKDKRTSGPIKQRHSYQSLVLSAALAKAFIAPKGGPQVPYVAFFMGVMHL